MSLFIDLAFFFSPVVEKKSKENKKKKESRVNGKEIKGSKKASSQKEKESDSSRTLSANAVQIVANTDDTDEDIEDNNELTESVLSMLLQYFIPSNLDEIPAILAGKLYNFLW